MNLTISVPDELFPETQTLVSSFAVAMAQKLYLAQLKGRSGWASPDWEHECQQAVLEHLQKGDPIDVANFCAFMWHHKWSTQPTSSVIVDVDCGDKLFLVYSHLLSNEQMDRIYASAREQINYGSQVILAAGVSHAFVIRGKTLG